MTGRRLYGRPLDEAELERLFHEYHVIGRWLGINERDLLPDWPSFEAWFEEFVRTKLVVTETAGDVLATFESTPPSPFPWLPRFLWAAIGVPLARLQLFVTVGTLPEETREALGYSWSRPRQLAFEGFRRQVRWGFALIPPPLRMAPVWRQTRRIIQQGGEPRATTRIRAPYS